MINNLPLEEVTEVEDVTEVEEVTEVQEVTEVAPNGLEHYFGQLLGVINLGEGAEAKEFTDEYYTEISTSSEYQNSQAIENNSQGSTLESHELGEIAGHENSKVDTEKVISETKTSDIHVETHKQEPQTEETKVIRYTWQNIPNPIHDIKTESEMKPKKIVIIQPKETTKAPHKVNAAFKILEIEIPQLTRKIISSLKESEIQVI